MSRQVVVRVHAPNGSKYAPDGWNKTVGKSVPVRVTDHTSQQGWRAHDTICRSVTVAANGKSVDLALDAFDCREIVLGMLVDNAEVVSGANP